MTDRPISLGIVEDLAGYYLRRAYKVIAIGLQTTFAGTGLREVHLAILSVVDANPGVNQGIVGRNLGIQRANMVSLITELVDAKLIDRHVAATDRRAFALFLTNKGEKALADCSNQLFKREEELFSSLSPAERSELVQLLKRVATKE